MAKNKSNVVDIPMILLDDRVSAESKLALVPPFAPEMGLSFEEALHFIDGLKTYLERDDEEGSSYFKFKLDDVEVIEREIDRNGKKFVLGKKARLHFKGTAWKSDKIEDQFIDTEWIEFNGWNPETMAFSLALGTKIYELAQELVGETVVVRKHVFETDSGRVRYVAHIRKGFDDSDSDDDDDNSSRSRRRGNSGGRRNKSSWKSDIEEAVNKFDKKGNILNEDDLDFLNDLDGSNAKEIKSGVKDYLEITAKDLADVEPDDDALAEYAVELLIESLPED